MAKISSYPILSTPSINDLLIGTDVDNLNITKNFSIGDIASFIIGGSYVPYIGATENVDLGAFEITSSAFIVGGGVANEFLKADGSLDSTVYQPAGNYITQLSGEATATGPGNASVTLSNSAVINKVLTGLTVTGSVILPTDSILTAFGKVQNQINTLVGGVQYQGTWNADTNTPTLTSSVGVQGHYYVVSAPGSTNLNGITDWKLGDWAIYNGTAWDKIDNTDAVISVNGEVGAVVLTTTNISEGTNLYFTNSRARTAINLTTTGNSGAATYNNTNGFFNIPEYTLAGLGGVPLTRQLTINGTEFDLSANRSWNVGTVTSVGTSSPLTGGTITGSGTIGITQATSSTDGYLSSTDWTTFNNKQNAITNPVTGTGTAFFLPMWASTSGLINSPLSYASDAFTFGYNSATGGTVNFTNSGLTTYTYSIQMNNFGSPRSTIHSYTDGVVVQSIGGAQVSRVFANGNTVLGIGLVDNGNKLEIEGSLKVNTIDNATTDTDRFLVSDSGVIKYRTGTELRLDIGAGVGSVTSVGLTMPSAFSVANSPITGSGTLAVTGAGSASQYVRGDGTLADFPTTTGGGSSVSYYLNGSVSQGTIGGVAYRELSEAPIFGAGTDISIAADGYIASFITDAGDPALLNIPAGNWNFETYFSASSGGGSPSFYVELYRYDGTTFTLIASNSSVPELISFGTNIQPYFSTLAVPQTALALTDRLAIRYYVVHDGRTITLHTEDNHLCQVVTTFSNGLTALNGLTAQIQYFQVGTAGTDFNISSASATHTFNLPTASATNRGALSSADWTTFNSKQNALTLTTTGTSGAATLVGATLNIPNYGSALGAYLPLAGGTMTGAIVGTTSTFTNSGSGIGVGVTNSGTGDGIKINHSSGRAFNIQSSGTGFGIIINNETASTSAPFTIQKQGGTVISMTDAGALTLAGALNGTSAIFSGDLQSSTRVIAVNGGESIILHPNSGGSINRIEGSAGAPLHIVTSGSSLAFAAGGTTPQVIINNVGNLSGPSASFSGSVNDVISVTSTASTTAIKLNNTNANDWGSNIAFQSSSINKGFVGLVGSLVGNTDHSICLFGASGQSVKFFTNANTTPRLTLDSSTGAATFVGGTGGINFTNSTTITNTASSGFTAIYANGGGIYLGGAASTNHLSILSTGAATFSSSVTIEGSGSQIRSGNELRFWRADNAIYTKMFDAGSTAANGFTFDNLNAEGFHFKNNGTTIMRMNSSGNVGIGTASPQSWTRLEVAGTAGAQTDAAQQVTITAPTTTIGHGAGLRFNAASGAKEAVGIVGMVNEASGNLGAMTFHTYGGGANIPERMRITSGGGINTYGPYLSMDGGGLGGPPSGLGYGLFPHSGIGLGISSVVGMSFWTGSTPTERMRITEGGFLKASNTGSYANASGTFHEINQSLNGSATIINTHSGNSDPYGVEVNFTGHDPNNATNYMFGAYKTSGGFVWIYRIFSNGTVSARSDARWKKNIETTRNGYIDDLCKLRVVKYNWYNHEDDAPKELGLIAQEVEEVFPNLIQIDPVIAKREVEQEDGTIIEEEFEDGVSRSIKTSVLPFMLLKAIQEQQAQIEELKVQIDSLKNQIK